MTYREVTLRTRLTSLDIASVAYLLLASAGVMIGVRENRVADFAGIKMGQRISVPWVMLWGTALSPPLLLMVVHSVLTLLRLRGGNQRRIATAGLSVLGLGYTVGALGEPILYESLSHETFSPRNAVLACGLIGLPPTMTFLGVREARSHRPVANPERSDTQ